MWAQPGPQVVESARQIPIAVSADIVVAGGGMAGVSAALEAVAKGRSVVVIAPRLSLGEDLADTMRLWLEEGEKPTGVLTERIFQKPGPAAPLRLKKILEEALWKAGVKCFLGSMVTDVLVDAAGKPAGLVMANRAGRQAVTAKMIVDATSGASVARLAGAAFHGWAGGELEVRRVVMGGASSHEEKVLRRIAVPEEGQTFHEYGFKLNVEETNALAMANLEQQARDLTYRPGQLRASARVHFVPPAGSPGGERLAHGRDSRGCTSGISNRKGSTACS